MKNIYLVQPNNLLSNSIYLPYSAGCLVAYAFSQDGIKKEYEFGGFVYEKQPVKEVISGFNNPFLIGFSSYMWNIEYNLQLAEAIKSKFPDCIVVFGGPQIPDDTDYLNDYSFIDILIHGEGERAFYEILNHKKLKDIDNISFRQGEQAVKNKRTISCDISSFPSPYLSGLFDGIIHNPDNSDRQFDAILETNRGCPYNCIYCCWAESGTEFRKFPMEKVKGELDWMAKNRISFCLCADGNFGILARDEEIAEYIVSLKYKYGFPEKFETTSAKEKNDLVFRINKKLEDAGLNRGVSIAVQSMSADVLRISGRKNMSVEELSKELNKYREHGMFTYTDLILGLPGETFESFCRGMFNVIEAGQHTSINISRLELLPNTQLYSKKFIEKYKIQTITSHLCQNHSPVTKEMDFGSRSEIVVQTNTMNTEEWHNALVISNCTLCFHCMGLLRYIAIYLRKIYDINYYDFYMTLYKKLNDSEGKIHHYIDDVFGCVDSFLNGKGNLEYYNKKYGNIYFPFDEALFLECATNIEEFYNEIFCFLKDYNNKELTDLLKFQKSLIALPKQESESVVFEYDWYDYFNNALDEKSFELKKKKTVINFSATFTDDLADYAKTIVWRGKRNNKMIRKIEKLY